MVKKSSGYIVFFVLMLMPILSFLGFSMYELFKYASLSNSYALSTYSYSGFERALLVFCKDELQEQYDTLLIEGYSSTDEDALVEALFMDGKVFANKKYNYIHKPIKVPASLLSVVSNKQGLNYQCLYEVAATQNLEFMDPEAMPLLHDDLLNAIPEIIYYINVLLLVNNSDTQEMHTAMLSYYALVDSVSHEYLYASDWYSRVVDAKYALNLSSFF